MVDRTAAVAILALALSAPAFAQEVDAPKSVRPPEGTRFDIAAVVQGCCAVLVDLQEEMDANAGRREWPYEGVYRVSEGGKPVIPIGYRVGGTAISALALIEAPGYADHPDRSAAVRSGVEFILEALDRPLMQPSLDDAYDVRGWGHIYALLLLLRLAELERVPAGLEDDVASRTDWLVDALEHTAIPKLGGWNYAGRSSPSPFMTGPGVQALFHAAALGHDVEPKVLIEAIDSLERGRAATGSIAYSTPGESRGETTEDELRFMDKLPGSMGRMAAVETTLWAAGRGNEDRLATAIDSFFVHWEQLEVRRKQNGTHIQPYGVAPYYFMYAHYYIAQAIELQTDAAQRDSNRTRLRDILAKVAEGEGGWNDRVFARSRNYGTAMGMMALLMKELPKPREWRAPDESPETLPASKRDR